MLTRRVHGSDMISAVSSLFMFFFYCYGDHRHLHSFPTRRSSDLPEGKPKPNLPENRPNASVPQTKLDAILSATRDRENRDRKSTRLNSSHVAISYAVFCLKKKIKRL